MFEPDLNKIEFLLFRGYYFAIFNNIENGSFTGYLSILSCYFVLILSILNFSLNLVYGVNLT